MGIFLTILAAVLILVGLAVVVKGKWTTQERIYTGKVVEVDYSIRPYGAGVVLAGLLVLFLSSFTVIGAKEVGVNYAFGKASGTLTSGWNWVAPWSSVEKFDAALQPLKLSGGKDDNGDPIEVRMNGNTITANVEVSMEWQLDDTADITPLWKEYRTFDKITENVVRRRLSAALNTVFDKYDPLASLKGDGTTVPTSTLEKSVVEELDRILPKGVRIHSLFIPKVIYPDTVQAQLNQYIAAVNDTKIAQQQKLTAEQRRLANEELTKGGAILTPGVLYQNCLDLVERLMKDGKALPAAFSCGAPPTTVVPVK
jgi:regulator of protease activity HflC (stomatin/prohibitin superfamily)